MFNKKTQFGIKNILFFIGLVVSIFSSNFFYDNNSLEGWLKNSLFEISLIVLIISALFLVINTVIYFNEEDK